MKWPSPAASPIRSSSCTREKSGNPGRLRRFSRIPRRPSSPSSSGPVYDRLATTEDTRLYSMDDSIRSNKALKAFAARSHVRLAPPPSPLPRFNRPHSNRVPDRPDATGGEGREPFIIHGSEHRRRTRQSCIPAILSSFAIRTTGSMRPYLVYTRVCYGVSDLHRPFRLVGNKRYLP